MAETPEEQELDLGIVEPAPRSAFIGLPPTPHFDGSEEDDVLPYISRKLLEEDVVDELLCQYPDHPTLLQTQRLFAQALSGTSSNALALWPCNSVELQSSMQSMVPASHRNYSILDTTAAAAVQSGAHGRSVQDPAPVSMNGRGRNIQFRAAATDLGPEPNTMLPVENSTWYNNMVSMAFFRGMEEANKFLPSSHADDTVGCRGRKKRLDEADDEAEAGAGRIRKQMAADGQGLAEEAAARELLDRLILKRNGYEPSPADMQELRVTVEMEKTSRRRRGASAEPAVDLHSMLIRCADAVATNDRDGAVDLLEMIRRHSSPVGDATQRLAHWFAWGLEARLAGTGSLRFRSLMAKRASAGVLEAYQLYMAACCFFPVSYLFSNKAIYNAVAGRKKLHIVNFGLSHGLQWPDLLRWLARREGGPPEVRLTSIDTPQPGFRPARHIEEKGRRLSDCAHRFGVPFKFHGISATTETVRADDLDIDPDEVLVVNSLFHFRTLMEESIATDGAHPNAVDMVLNAVAEMRPSVFIHGIVNASYSTAFFATRFREALYNFTALFDMMDTTMPRDSDKRLLFERDILARSVTSMIACEGKDRVERPRSYRQWQARSRRAGLRQLPLDTGTVKMIRDKVKKEYHKCFVIDEDHQWLLQGWKGRVLYALSTWTVDDGLAMS